jgi:glucokinase
MISNKHRIGAIGLDIGGTKTAAGIVLWPSGEILHRTVNPTSPQRGGEAILGDILALALRLKEKAEQEEIRLAAIGAGVAELVDCDGNVTSRCTIAWRGLPVQEKLSTIAAARVESDVRAAAFAEAVFGAGRGKRLFVYITVGTGISYCLMQNGQPLKGANGNAILMASGPLSTVCTQCGAKLHPVLEEYASGPAIARRFAQAKRAESVENCQGVFRAASNGDQDAIGILNSAGEALGVSAAFLVNILDPEMIVLGGGLGTAGGIYQESFDRSCREHIFAENSRKLPIVLAKLGIDAGVIGAAAIALTQQDNKEWNYAYETN